MFSANVFDAKVLELAEKWTSPRPWARTVTVGRRAADGPRQAT